MQIVYKMTQETYTLEAMAEVVEKQGLAVFELTKMPVFEGPIIPPYVIIVLCNQGWVKAEFDFTPSELIAHDFTLLNPNHTLVPLETSEDYHVSVLVLSQRIFEYLAEMFPDNYKYIHYYENKFHLTDRQYEGIKSCFNQLKIVSTIEHPFRNKLLTSQLDIMAHLTEIYCTENGFVPAEKTGADKLLLDFHAAIAENYNKSREVQFYADLLCLSPKYFGSIVRQALGYSAGELIARYVMVQAKQYLLYHKNLSIQQISDKMGFVDQTAFARYFKSHAGISPQEFRGKKR